LNAAKQVAHAAAPLGLDASLAEAKRQVSEAFGTASALGDAIARGDESPATHDGHRLALRAHTEAVSELARLSVLHSEREAARRIEATKQAARDRQAAERAADRAYLAALQEQHEIATRLAGAFALIPPMLEALTANTDRLRDFMRRSPAASRGGTALGAAAPNTHDINGCVSRLVAVSKSGAEPFEDIQRASAAAIADAEQAIAERTDNDLPPTAA
jgi:hypothetical protein